MAELFAELAPALHRGALIATLIACTGLAILSLYLLILAGASFFGGSKLRGDAPKLHSFAVMIPAHNEELLLGALVRSLKQLHYPSHLYTIHVVADNCTDSTVEVGRAAGATVHERIEPTAPGKGHALNWLFKRLVKPHADQIPSDAFVVLDADSVVSPNYLAEMNTRLCAGHVAVQGMNDISNPVASWTASLRYIAFNLICGVRPLGRDALGLSAGLRGNGMCLTRAVVERFTWNPAAAAEDHELHMRMLQAGLKVAFAPEAHVYSQMPGTLQDARSQNIRWERGKIEVMRAYSPRLLLDGIRTGNWSMIDGALELMVPPFSLAFGASLGLVGLSLLLSSPFAIGLSVFTILAQTLYTVRGLMVMPNQSPRLYLALLYAPWFIAWKAWLYVAVALGAGRGQWVRTTRTADQTQHVVVAE